mgnify:CR=1 FL=1
MIEIQVSLKYFQCHPDDLDDVRMASLPKVIAYELAKPLDVQAVVMVDPKKI